MKVTIIVELNGLNSSRTFQGTPEDLALNDWNEKVVETIEGVAVLKSDFKN